MEGTDCGLMKKKSLKTGEGEGAGGGRNFNNLGPKIDDGDGVQANAATF
jgi:hypothetical protein